MRQSELFTRTIREVPKDEVSTNAQLLIRGGFVFKEMAGVYSYLPLGLRVLKKIENIIREEMNAIGGQEMLMTTLQDPEVWQASGRWADETDSQSGLPWFKTKLVAGGELGIANTHEEALARIMTRYVSSYRDLPCFVYQIQNKFRNELRAKSGLMRGREFIMKDLYSFTRTEEELETFYEKTAAAYMKIFARAGIGENTYRTFASGGAFSKFSDEFQTLSESGEDTIYVDKERNIAVNKEVYGDDVLREIGLEKDKLEEAKSIEVGNIFKLGTKYAEAEGLHYLDEKGKRQPVVMGSYGIGLGRLMGAIVEVSHDEKGIVWPGSVAPFTVHLVELSDGKGSGLYRDLQKKGVEVLYDERDVSPGEKLVESDLLGIPWRVVISEKTGDKVEAKKRDEKDAKLMEINEFVALL